MLVVPLWENNQFVVFSWCCAPSAFLGVVAAATAASVVVVIDSVRSWHCGDLRRCVRLLLLLAASCLLCVNADAFPATVVVAVGSSHLYSTHSWTLLVPRKVSAFAYVVLHPTKTHCPTTACGRTISPSTSDLPS